MAEIEEEAGVGAGAGVGSLEAAAAEANEAAAPERWEALPAEAGAEIREETAVQLEDAIDVKHEIQRVEEQPPAPTAAGAPLAFNRFRAIVVEANDYSRRSIDNGSSFVHELVGADSFESIIRIQSEYAKISYSGFIAHVTKLASILASSAWRPKSL